MGQIGLVPIAAVPFPPMGRADVQPLLGFHLYPTGSDAPAREYERVQAVIVDDGQFEIAVERRGRNMFPHFIILKGQPTAALT